MVWGCWGGERMLYSDSGYRLPGEGCKEKSALSLSFIHPPLSPSASAPGTLGRLRGTLWTHKHLNLPDQAKAWRWVIIWFLRFAPGKKPWPLCMRYPSRSHRES